jgi:NitT/TauT family transport system substrate-binding protein
LIKGIVSDSVDVGLTSLAGVSLGIRAGQGLKAFYSGFNMPSFDWYALPKYKNIKDTKGARYGISRFGSSTDFLTRYALIANGLDPEKDVKILQGGRSATRLAAMEAGQLDVNIFAAPEKFISEDKGYNLIIRQRDLAKDYPFHTFFAKEAFIKSNPNTLKAMLRGVIKGIRLMRSNKALALKILGKRIKMDEKYLDRTYNDFTDFIFEDGRLPSKRGMEVFFQQGIMSGTYKEVWPEEKYFDRTYVDTYNQWKP